MVLETNTFGAGGECVLSWRQMHFALETNTLVLEMDTLKTRIRTSATHTQLATSDFQQTLRRDHCYTDKYSNLKTSGIMFLCSPPSMLYPQVICTQRCIVEVAQMTSRDSTEKVAIVVPVGDDGPTRRPNPKCSITMQDQYNKNKE